MGQLKDRLIKMQDAIFYISAMLTFAIACIGYYVKSSAEKAKSGEAKAAQSGAADSNKKIIAANDRIETLTRELKKNDDEKTDLMKKIVAISGNNKVTLRQLIAANETVLMAQRGTGASLLDDVLSKLPATQKTFEEQQQSRASEFATFESEFEFSWRPLVRFVVGQYDKGVAELKGKGFPLQVGVATDEFPLMSPQGGRTGSVGVRDVQLGGVRFQVYQNIGVKYPEHADNSVLIVQLDYGSGLSDAVLQVWMSEKRLELKSSYRESLSIDNPGSGRPPIEVTEFARAAITKGFEQLLIRSQSSR